MINGCKLTFELVFFFESNVTHNVRPISMAKIDASRYSLEPQKRNSRGTSRALLHEELDQG